MQVVVCTFMCSLFSLFGFIYVSININIMSMLNYLPSVSVPYMHGVSLVMVCSVADKVAGAAGGARTQLCFMHAPFKSCQKKFKALLYNASGSQHF